MSGSSRSSSQLRSIVTDDHDQDKGIRPLVILAVVSAAIYVAITFLSAQFAFESATADRPIIFVLLLFGLLFIVYLLAIRYATKANQDTKLIGLIVIAAVVFRLIVSFSVPIQEVDIYRYLWDGAVSSQGVSPFRYPPSQVTWADANNTEDTELRKLARLRDRNPALAEVLRRVHFGDLPTIYPPTSQAVFYGVAITTPNDAAVMTRVWIMKAWLIGFDLGILLLVIKLLKLSQLPVGLCLAYAWCPLLLKEVANSGHLDAIAVFLTTLTVYLVVRLRFNSEKSLQNSNRIMIMILAAFLLAAAVGAKLYPVVLAPLLLLTLTRRFGWQALVLPTIIFVLTTFLLLRPIMPTQSAAVAIQSSGHADLLGIPIPTDADAIETKSPLGPALDPNQRRPPNDPSLGVATFLKSWEMNDFIFMILVENLKLNDAAAQPVWFSIAPEGFRQPIANSVAQSLSIPVAEAPFLITRMATSVLFVFIACWLAWRASMKADIASFCEAGFLTLAWFWLLLPTQNPWYWLWALPFLPFARNRAWFAISGIVFVYYLRFWFDYHFANTAVWGTPYQGTDFFDFVVTWIEFAPWFVWLAVEHWRRKKLGWAVWFRPL